MKSLTITILLFCFSCGADLDEQTKSEPEVSKADLLNQNGKADTSVDYCAKFGWYGDGECDLFCLFEDVQDCGAEVDLECAKLCEVRGDNVCLTSADCEETCENERGNWSDEQLGSFSDCLEQPLCYQTAEQCMNSASIGRFCEDACSEQQDNPFGWCGYTECIQYCWEHINEWDSSTERAFLLCANENPLCYQTLESCISAGK